MNDKDILGYHQRNRPKIDTASDPRYLFLLDYLQEYGPLSLAEVAADVGIDHSIALQILNGLLAGGLAAEERDGSRWAVSDAGTQFLNRIIGLPSPAPTVEVNRRYKLLGNKDLLLTCLRDNSVGAWTEFVRRFQPVISGVIAQMTSRYEVPSHPLVEDLTQEVYLKLCSDEFRVLRNVRLENENSLFALLKVMAANVTHDHLRKHHKLSTKDESLSSKDIRLSFMKEPHIEQEVLLQEIEQIVQNIAVGPNANRDRVVFWLRYREGFTPQEIAAISTFKLTQKGVEVVLFRTLRRLQKALRLDREGPQVQQKLKHLLGVEILD